ncbi:MAG: hypothetical protein HY290_22025 [Planctomycetia bacterium]|nr:hypothetical protein [Planctomycetia bacterium]
MTCQVGAEGALKREVAREWPALRFAFSRPGFLTFKLTSDKKLPDDWSERLVFARAAGFCLGKVEGTTAEDRAREVWQLFGAMPVSELHVWPRDAYSPGFRDYEPGVTAESAEVERVVRETRPSIGLDGSRDANHGENATGATPPAPPLLRGGKRAPVGDVIVVGPDEWWVGFHHVGSIVSTWPGGFLQATLPEKAVSRAWLKMQEAVLWSGFNMKRGEQCVEIGSAPGGAAQFLLSQGLRVTGIDPAVMDPAVLADEHFRHIRKRSKEVPRKEFVGVDWLTCDVNLPPNYTLDTVRAIVTHPGVQFKGLLLTLKLVEWSLADELPKYLDRIRSWGFRRVQARQLHHNRQEVCVAAETRRRTESKSRRGRKVEKS